jgi:hypothetical protein
MSVFQREVVSGNQPEVRRSITHVSAKWVPVPGDRVLIDAVTFNRVQHELDISGLIIDLPNGGKLVASPPDVLRYVEPHLFDSRERVSHYAIKLAAFTHELPARPEWASAINR